MPCLVNRFDSIVGLLIPIFVAPIDTITAINLPSAQLDSFTALIDTGASNTCISSSVAQTIVLTPIGMRPMISATHTVPMFTYLVDIFIPFENIFYRIPKLQVMEFNLGTESQF